MASPIYFPSHGYVTDKLPINLYNELLLETQNKTDKVSYKNQLVGNLSEEYLIKPSSDLNKYIASLCCLYNESFGLNVPSEFHYNISGAWVNYQKRYEYNSVHSHSGKYSFVIWMKIPYDLQEEMNQPHAKGSNGNTAAHFCFHYPSQIGSLSHYFIPVDKTFEGTIILFDSQLNHAVKPFFTTDDERVSVAGNVIIEN